MEILFVVLPRALVLWYRDQRDCTIWVQNCKTLLMPKDRICGEKYEVLRKHRCVILQSCFLSHLWVSYSVVDRTEKSQPLVVWFMAA